MLSDRERTVYEQQIRAVLGDAWRGLAERLVTALGNPPSPLNLPPRLWAELETATAARLEPLLIEAVLQSARDLARRQGVSVDWAGVNTRAAEWAAGYSFELVRGLTGTTRERLGQAITAYFQSPDQDLKTLAARVGELFGPTRGELIATTEVTRAAASGEDLLVREIRTQNPRLKVVQIWLTSRDEIVCPLCGPLHGVRANDHGLFVSPQGGTYTGPPAHPRCRCAVGTELADLEPTDA